MSKINQCTECQKFKKWEELREKYYTSNPYAMEPDEDQICDECFPEFYKN